MGIGTAVRHRLGRFEIPMANAYRAAFINLRVLADRIAAIAPASRILEVGCGDGSLAERLMRAYPDAEYDGIDIAPTAGRLYRGDPDRARFRTITLEQFTGEHPKPYDVVLMVDVVHHVPMAERADLVRRSADLVGPGGFLMVKEFERNRGPYYWLTYAADRYITGDRGVSFLTSTDVREMVGAVPGFDDIVESRIPPARNNVLLVRRRLD
jgi:2-polyprenyl-3-methyl-5-hydroxy-6-metoxy-1,4-benzoquinol methylase